MEAYLESWMCMMGIVVSGHNKQNKIERYTI